MGRKPQEEQPSSTDGLLDNARRYAEAFAGEGLEAAPARKVAVLACMDARLIPTRILGLKEGEAHVIRNAGGVASDDAIRSLAVSQHLLGTEEVVVIQHTDCGLLNIGEDELAERLEQAAGEPPPWPLHTFDDLEQSVREAAAAIRRSPFLPRTRSVRGFVFDVGSGELREVGPAASGKQAG